MRSMKMKLLLCGLLLASAGWGQIVTPAASGGGSGTVTSVSFTGGIISVATPTTTPALTVAGTSGGVPYFSSASTWASSGAGVAGAMMAWGGAGAAPTSPLSLLVTNQNSATETWTWKNTTASTGVSNFKFLKGAAQSTSPVITTDGIIQVSDDNNLNIQFGAGSTGFKSDSFGELTFVAGSSASFYAYASHLNSSYLGVGSSSGTTTVSFGSASSGVAEVNNGSNGTYRDLKLRNLTITGQVSLSGTRYLCVDTSGNVTASASACSGT